MKTKEYIQKYELDTKYLNKSKQTKLLADLAVEFNEICKSFNINDDLRKFESAVKQFRTKWDAISMKSRSGFQDGMWKFFYATVIAPKRDELVPSFAKRKAEKAERKRKWEESQAKKKSKNNEDD